ncbi:MAG: AAA family ATPase [Planctomycetota bacterium]|jgi:dethiobiotin synthetase
MGINLDLSRKRGLFILGSDAGVGKTVVAGGIARILYEREIKVGVFKPIATGCKRAWDGVVGEDTEFLAWCANSEDANGPGME